jgi:hypothetical protein
MARQVRVAVKERLVRRSDSMKAVATLLFSPAFVTANTATWSVGQR